MAVETYIKRTLYIAKCKCGETDERLDDPPRERFCSCGKWVPYAEQSYIGPDIKQS